MNTKDDIMKALWDNQNAQGVAKLMEKIVLPAISKMTEEQQIEAMGTVRDAVSDIAEYEECRHHMIETIKVMRKNILNMLPPWVANDYKIGKEYDTEDKD